MYHSILVAGALVRIGLAFAGLFVLLPMVLFRQERDVPALDVFYSNLVRMVFLCQVAAYALAAVRLYEVISILVVFLCTGLWRLRASRTPEERARLRARLTVKGLDLADYELSVSGFAESCCRVAALCLRRVMSVMRRKIDVVDGLLLALVLGYSAYLRFLDAIANAAPALSDSYVTLAWMKYIERRQLFHDGIYPHGFHIFLSLLHKFSVVDALFVLKYAGPLNPVLTTISCYYFVSRMTGHVLGGVASAFAYGCLPSFMPYEFQRQAATNSQEFAIVFLLPAVVYVVRYLGKGSKADLLAAFCAIGIVGLSHPVVAVFAAAGAFAAVCGCIVARVARFDTLARLAGAGLSAAIVSILPLAGGMLAGIPFHGSSVEFAAAEQVASWVDIRPVHGAVLGAGLAAAVLSAAFVRTRQARAGLLTCAFFTVISLLVYEAPALGVTNLALSTRSGEMYALALAVSLGTAVSAVVSLGSLGGGWWRDAWRWFSAAGLASAMVGVLLAHPQTPAHPYKMQTNESAEQYIRILLTDTPTDWLIVSDFEGYSLVLGRGWHLMTADFVSQVDPRGRDLVSVRDGVAQLLNMSSVYLFYEENPYKPPIDAALPQYEAKIEAQSRLKRWISEYESDHGPLEVYHRGPDLTIYVIRHQNDKRMEFEKIWGEG